MVFRNVVVVKDFFCFSFFEVDFFVVVYLVNGFDNGLVRMIFGVIVVGVMFKGWYINC